MDENEIIVELVNFLKEINQYEAFLRYENSRGFDENELSSDIEEIIS